MNQLIENNSQGEDISFGRVVAARERLKRHIKRSANVKLVNETSRTNGKSKIGNLPNLPAAENVGRFEVSVQNSLPC